MAAVETLVTDHLDLWTAALKRKSTAGRGSSAKVELYGIKKLRELILELAVRGLLVPQDPNDEPASELLKNIAAEKIRLVKAKAIRNSRPLAPVSDEEKFISLPAGWVFARLNDIGNWGAGATPSRNNPELYGGSIPWFKSGELVADYISQSEESVTELALAKASLRYNNVGDVLIAMYGATIGKTAILSVPATTNQAVCACTPFPGFESTYLLTLLKAYKPRFVGMGEGGAQPNISREKIIETVVAVPPTAEQHRIVAKVDELMALCDQLEQQTDASLGCHQTLVETLLSALTSAADHAQFASAWLRIASHFDTLFTTEESIDQLKQTILQLAVMGKLVPQDPNDEPASELLKKIAAEKVKLVKEGKIKKEKPLSPIEESDQPFKLPRGWEWARIEKATLFSEYGISEKTYETEDGIPVLKMGDIQDGKVLLGGQKKADPDFEGINELMLEDGDLLYNRTNSAELVGKTGIFRGPSNLYSFASYLIRIRCLDSAVQPAFLNASMNSMLFRKTQIEPHLKQQCGQANVNGTIMKNMIIPVAPIKEQTRIIAKLDESMALCDQIKSRLRDAQTTQLHLADALVEQVIG